MLRKKLLLAAFMFLLLPSASYAASIGDSNSGIGLGFVTFDIDDVDEARPIGGIIRIGEYITESIAIEGRLGGGIEEDTIDFAGDDIDIKIQNIIGLYGSYHFGDGSDVSPYVIWGFTSAEIKASSGGDAVEADDEGVSYGVGIEFNRFRLEYMSYLNKDDYTVTSIGLGYNF